MLCKGGNIESYGEKAVGQKGLMGEADDEKDQDMSYSRDKNDENAGFGRDESSK